MKDNVELRLVGITYNQIESGVYALILEDLEESKRLAIVIGYPEAQSIECHLQKVRTPRPLSHDLLATMLNTLGATLLRVDIHRMSTGPYAGKLTILDSNGQKHELDARSSDAIALAIRVGAPIYTTRQLLDEKGYSPQKKTKDTMKNSGSNLKDNFYQNFTVSQLEEMLKNKVIEENYEAAAEIKKEIERRKNQGDK